ncbi:MAG: hypothetical protein LBN35_03455 [Clostridiales Family XIII bacterium]|jgi:hypothetical protein|nr:hypothetical protein [Clostridiales Family XIII bacterium]
MMNALSHINVDSYVLVCVITAFISMLLLTGILLLMRRQIVRFAEVVKSRRRLSPARKPNGDKKHTGLTGLTEHLNNTLRSVMKHPISATAFLSCEIILFFLVFMASATNLSIPMSVITGLSFAMIPYLYLRVRLERIRRRGSYEGEALMAALLTQYWVAGSNIFMTMERVIENTKDIRISKKLLSSLLIELRSTGSKARIKNAADAFAYGIGTNWSRMLAYNIRIAAITGCDIGLALEDILAQLREARTLHEERKRINGESVRLVIFLIPLIYIGSAFVSVGMLGLTPARFLRNQFLTAEGFGLFCFTVFLFMVNIVLLEVVTNKKLDF